MDELVAWYRACLDDDERAAKEATPGRWAPSGHSVITSDDIEIADVPRDDATHIARHDPAAVLADIAAKKKLLAALEDMTQDDYNPWAWNHIAILASAYRHRPGWRTDWE